MTNSRSTTQTIGSIDEFTVGDMKMAKVGERRVAVIRTSNGIHALDNACPHQGYGLVTGSLDGHLLTCQWHNWKFRVEDGRCVVGEEDVACHAVDVGEDGSVNVTVVEPDDHELREQLWPSLERGFLRDYVGQMARDTARLLKAGADPIDIVWRGIALAAPRSEYGIGHGLAMATDCLHLLDQWDGLERTLPIVQALSGLSEPSATARRTRCPKQTPRSTWSTRSNARISTRRRPRYSVSWRAGSTRSSSVDSSWKPPAPTISPTATAPSTPRSASRSWSSQVGTAPLNSCHGSSCPWCTAPREDTLPYMRKAKRAIDAVDLDALAAAPSSGNHGLDRRRRCGTPGDPGQP